MTRSSAPASTDIPSRTWISATVPSRLARSSFSIFIASTTTTGWRAATGSPRLHEHADDLAGHRRHEPLRSPEPVPAPSSFRPQRRRPFSVTATGVAPTCTASCPPTGSAAMLTSFDHTAVYEQRQRVRVNARRVHLPGPSVDGDCKTVARAGDRRPGAGVRRSRPRTASTSSAPQPFGAGLGSPETCAPPALSGPPSDESAASADGDITASRAAAMAASSSSAGVGSTNGRPLRAFSTSSR